MNKIIISTIIILMCVLPISFALNISGDTDYAVDINVKWDATWNNGKYDLNISWKGTGADKVGKVVLFNVSENTELYAAPSNKNNYVSFNVTPGNYAVRLVSDDGMILGSFPLHLKDIKQEVVAAENLIYYLIFGLFMMLISNKLNKRIKQ